MQNGIEPINYEQSVNNQSIAPFNNGYKAGKKDAVSEMLELLSKEEIEHYKNGYRDYAKICAQLRARLYEL